MRVGDVNVVGPLAVAVEEVHAKSDPVAMDARITLHAEQSRVRFPIWPDRSSAEYSSD